MKFAKLFPLLIIVDFIFYGCFLLSFPFYTFRIGVKFSLPSSLPSVDNFYDFSENILSILLSLFGMSSLFGTVLLHAFLSLIITVPLSYLGAGYLGTIHHELNGAEKKPFTYYASKYFTLIFAYKLIWWALWAILTLFIFFSIFLTFLSVASLLLLGYLFFLTPFIIVVDELPIQKAISASINYAFSGTTVGFAISYFIVNALISAVIYLLMNIPIIGFIINLFIAAYAGTALSIATFYFYYDLKKKI